MVHAALGEPARLRIVDLLGLGDRSPAELQAELGMASNLLSHHLRTLEEAGVVSRHRSEADRRRSYVKLERDGLAGLLPAATVQVPRVLFVCYANSARSQLAEALWRRASPVPSVSAGTHPAAGLAPGARDVAARHGLDLAGSRPEELSQVARLGDLLVAVCDRAHEELPVSDRLHWSVPDPVAIGTPAAFEAAFSELSERVRDLSGRVAAA
ncbi:putative regulatory protein, ArsR family [Sinomonas cyclohexanicum]|uniref:Regulatory protein, ArsR family n=2 Tax=Sinomonas cyclohexanicum TaxID=322009 RepID=A0ABM7PSG8_SINCY|nr:putative regulatory protein, ArsR family [Corynebacterium cyclohexanicum]